MGNAASRHSSAGPVTRTEHPALAAADPAPFGRSSKTWPPSHLQAAAVIFCPPCADAQTLTGYVARQALFRTDDGSSLLDVVSENRAEREEGIPFSRLQRRAGAGP